MVGGLRVSQEVAKSSSLKSSIELLRFLSALGIVWFHTKAPGLEFAYAALPVFLILSAYLATLSLMRKRSDGYVAGRVRRILVPWLAWCLIFMAVRFAWTFQLPDFAALAQSPGLLLVGPVVHLWYLPFVFAGSLFILGFTAYVTDRTRFFFGAAFVGFLSISAFYLLSEVTMPQPAPNWAFAFPSFGIGVLLAMAPRFDLNWLAIVIVLLVGGVVHLAGFSHGLTQFLLGVIIFLIFWNVEWDVSWFRMLGDLSFGIYLVHPMFLSALYKWLPDFVGTVPGVILIFIPSMLVTYVLRQSLMTRWLT